MRQTSCHHECLRYWHRRATEQSTCRRCNPCAVHARISDPLIWRIIPILHPYQSLKLANDYSSCRICAIQDHLLLVGNCPLMQTYRQPFLLMRTGFPSSRRCPQRAGSEIACQQYACLGFESLCRP